MKPEICAALYAAFALDEHETGNPAGLAVPLEEMGWDELEKLEDTTALYDLSVMKYVLPRWLQLLDEDGGGCPDWILDEEGLKWSLQRKQWTQWPPAQAEGVRAVFREWGQVRMRAGHMGGFVDFLSQLEEEVAPYLDPWLRARPLEVAQWVGAQNWMRVDLAITRWAIEPRVEERLEAAFWANPGGENSEVFSGATQLLRSVRALNAGR